VRKSRREVVEVVDPLVPLCKQSERDGERTRGEKEKFEKNHGKVV
jgi:hypothetical protein